MADNTDKNALESPEVSRRRYLQGTAALGLAGIASGGAVAEELEALQQDDDRSFREKLDAGEPVYGVSAAMAGMDPITVTSFLPTDWIWVDTEHASYGVREVREMVSVVPEGTATLTRVPGADPKEVERVLDAGSDGVIVPKLRTVEEVQAFVESAYYPPRGDRGVAGSPASTFGLEFGTEYIEQANEEVFVVIQVETREIVENIEEVAQIDGIDSLLIGPADLSSQLGDPLNTDTQEFQAARDRVLRAAQSNDILPGYWVGGNDAEPFVEEGWRVLSLGSDAGLLAAGVRDRLDRAP